LCAGFAKHAVRAPQFIVAARGRDGVSHCVLCSVECIAAASSGFERIFFSEVTAQETTCAMSTSFFDSPSIHCSLFKNACLAQWRWALRTTHSSDESCYIFRATGKHEFLQLCAFSLEFPSVCLLFRHFARQVRRKFVIGQAKFFLNLPRCVLSSSL